MADGRYLLLARRRIRKKFNTEVPKGRKRIDLSMDLQGISHLGRKICNERVNFFKGYSRRPPYRRAQVCP